MAKKTMLRQLLSHWGMLSTDMQEAFEADGETITNDGNNLVPEIDAGDTEPIEPVQPNDAPVPQAAEPEKVDISAL